MTRWTALLLFFGASHVSADQILPDDVIAAETQARMTAILSEGLKDGDITKNQYEQTLKWVRSTPCVGVARTLSKEDKRKFPVAIARQFQQKTVEILKSFKDGSWFIILATAGDGDTPYLFYSKSPNASNKPIAMWSGATPIYETEDVYEWVREEAHGIPDRLAQCFAWYVSLKAQW